MTLVRMHIERCRRDRHVRGATLGLGAYAALALSLTAYAALLPLWP